MDIQINNTTLIIGEIVQIYVPEDCMYEDGFIDLEKANTVTCSGLDSYHKTIQLDRLSYAKPNKIAISFIEFGIPASESISVIFTKTLLSTLPILSILIGCTDRQFYISTNKHIHRSIQRYCFKTT